MNRRTDENHPSEPKDPLDQKRQTTTDPKEDPPFLASRTENAWRDRRRKSISHKPQKADCNSHLPLDLLAVDPERADWPPETTLLCSGADLRPQTLTQDDEHIGGEQDRRSGSLTRRRNQNGGTSGRRYAPPRAVWAGGSRALEVAFYWR